MADFLNNQTIAAQEWVDVTSGGAAALSNAPGTKAFLQNLTGSGLRIFLGSAAPTTESEGVLAQPNEIMSLTIDTKVWARSLTGGTIHLSAAD